MITVRSVFVLWLLATARLAGGALVLWWLAAPGWTLAAWLMMQLRIHFDFDRSKIGRVG
jgi:hypothetical protein